MDFASDVSTMGYGSRVSTPWCSAFFAMSMRAVPFLQCSVLWRGMRRGRRMEIHGRCPCLFCAADTAARLAHICEASDVESLRRALLELDLSLDPCHLDKLLRLLNSSVLGAFGPEASRFWRRQPLDDQQIDPPRARLMALLPEFLSAWFLRASPCCIPAPKFISLQPAEFPKRQRKAHPMQEPPRILLPAHSRAAASSSSARKATVSFNWGQTSRFRAAHHADTWAEHFRHECVDMRVIASMGVTDLKAVLQAVPAGVFSRLHEASRWLEEAPVCGCHHFLLWSCVLQLLVTLPGQEKSTHGRRGNCLLNKPTEACAVCVFSLCFFDLC